MRRYDLKTKITKSLYKLVPQQGVKIGVTMGSTHRKLISLYLILQIGIFFFRPNISINKSPARHCWATCG